MKRVLSKRDAKGQISIGYLFDLPNNCQRYRSGDKCKQFYHNIFTNGNNGFHVCPYGHVVYYDKQYSEIYWGLKVKGIGKKGKNAGIGIYLPEMTQQRILDIISGDRGVGSLEMERNNIVRMKNELLHGMEKILGTCRAKSEALLAAMDNDNDNFDLELARQDLLTVLMGNIQLRNLFYATRLRFDNSLPNKCFDVQVYNKFFKSKKLLNHYMGRRVSIQLTGQTYSRYNLTAAFEIIPYLLLENAVKFSLDGGEVGIVFHQNGKRLDIEMSNIGPHTEKSQEELFQDGIRGENSGSANVDGSGIGLFTCKQISDLNGIKLFVESKKHIITFVNGIPYSEFLVNMEFPEELYVDSVS